MRVARLHGNRSVQVRAGYQYQHRYDRHGDGEFEWHICDQYTLTCGGSGYVTAPAVSVTGGRFGDGHAELHRWRDSRTIVQVATGRIPAPNSVDSPAQ